MSNSDVYMSISDVLEKIKTELDSGSGKKVSTLFAYNSSGKTRLSKEFYDQNKGKVLYYNAFTEDLFSWDNKKRVLKIQANKWIFEIIQERALESRIKENFNKFIGLELKPIFDFPMGQISFRIPSDDDVEHIEEKSHAEGDLNDIKISRGEESVFVWSIFYTILETGLKNLEKGTEDEPTSILDNIEYIVIDDPVSSMDDTRIITVALELAKLISNSKYELKFLITTHHPLFFNVLFNQKMTGGKKRRKNYLLFKTGPEYTLKSQNADSPFAYHHLIISEINLAIVNDNLKKYHYNLFRALLEKTANFLGYSKWNNLLSDLENYDTFIKKLDHFSHDRLSDLDQKELTEEEKEDFQKVFESFIDKYNWDKSSITS